MASIAINTTMRSTTSSTKVQAGNIPALSDAFMIPEVLPGFLLIRNLAASINPVDKYIGAGFFASRHPIFDVDKQPRAFGSDFAGVVVAVGDGATVTEVDGTRRPAQVGDLVFGDGIVGTGSFAEYVAVLAEQAVVKPHGISFVEAAALPLAGLTALQAMVDHAVKPVTKGSKVLILGGSGGVGSLAVQIAKALGASTVAATSSNTELLKRLGADIAINYREDDWSKKLAGQKFDLVFATVAEENSAERALEVLGPDGSFIYLLQSTALKDSENPAKGNRLYKFMLTNSKDGKGLGRIAQWVLEGKVRSEIHGGRAVPFTQAGWAELMGTLNSGRTKGKLVMDLA